MPSPSKERLADPQVSQRNVSTRTSFFPLGRSVANSSSPLASFAATATIESPMLRSMPEPAGPKSDTTSFKQTGSPVPESESTQETSTSTSRSPRTLTITATTPPSPRCRPPSRTLLSRTRLRSLATSTKSCSPTATTTSSSSRSSSVRLVVLSSVTSSRRGMGKRVFAVSSFLKKTCRSATKESLVRFSSPDSLFPSSAI
jgi:hypothetical protein